MFTFSPHSLCFSPSYTRPTQFTLSLFAFDSSDHLSILGPGNSLVFCVTQTHPKMHPQHSLSLSIFHFLLKPFFSLLHPLPQSSSPWGVFESAEPRVRMFHRVTQINVPSLSASRHRAVGLNMTQESKERQKDFKSFFLNKN